MKFIKLIIFLLVKINLIAQLTASFSSDTTSGCSPLVVNFNNTSNNAISYYWEFSNGTTSTLFNPSATFINPGLYTVKLVAFDGSNYDSIILVDYIHVFDQPVASFNYNILEDCQSSNLISFSNTSSGANSYVWDFGNGDTSSVVSPLFSYNSSGDFPITLIAVNGLNCRDDSTINPISIFPNPIISASCDTFLICDSSYNFTFTGSSSNSNIATWNWSFGDGNFNISSNSNTTYNYSNYGTFIPSVIATSNEGCIDSITLSNISIYPPEAYSLTSNKYLGCPPLNVTLNISPIGSINSVNWNFDDGNTSPANPNTNHQYLSNGIFNPSAFVESNNGCIQEIQIDNVINVSNGPTGSFIMSNISGCPPLPVQFDISTSASNSVNINLGDGNISNTSNLIHNYSENGVYYPILTISDTNNCQSIINLDTVRSGISNIDFIGTNTEGCAALNVNFFNLAPDAVDFYWDFGDNTFSTDPNPEHTYDSVGLYSVTFVANDTNSCFDTLIKTDFINVTKDEIDVSTVDTIKACSPYIFNTDVYNIGVNFWNWDFGDGVLDSGSNVNHLYTESGNYHVSLNTDAPNGCQYDLPNFAYIIIDSIETDVNLNLNSDCNSGSINILNNSTGAIQHQWNMGDGNVYYTANVQHNYNTSQPYVITYESVSSLGCKKTSYYSVIFDCNSNNPVVIPMPPQNPINSLVDPVSGNNLNQTCGPQNVNLISPFSNAFAWQWDFGDGQTSNLQNPSHFYANSGIYNVRHIGFNPDGSSDTLIINNFVDQYTLDANFSLTKSEYCNYNTYYFDNSSSNAISWEWTLDSNIISNNSVDSITIPLNDSVSTLNLKISDQYGCISKSEQNVFLHHPLAIIEQDSFACVGSNLIFSCCVKDDPIHYWDMTDGNLFSPDTAVLHQYQQTGWFNPILTLDNPGCIRQIVLDSIEIFRPDASFSPTFQNPICKTDSLMFKANNSGYSNYLWSGGDVNNNSDSVWIQLNQSGLQVISLSISSRGCSNSFTSDSILVNEATADFNYTLLNNCIPIDVVFLDSSINPVSWEWNLSNISTSNLQNPTQQFLSFPNDSIQLTITDVNGCKDSIKKEFVNDFNAEFIVSDSLICAGTLINFYPVSEVVNTWLWDFGDGIISTDSTPTHTYQNAGVYDIELIASDGQGCIDTTIKYNHIVVNKVVADFNHIVSGTCPPVTTSFSNLSSGASSYEWDFGDNLNSIIDNPAHVYTSPGYYDISLIAKDNFGCSDTLQINNLVYIPGPILDFSIDQNFGCDSLQISITNNSFNTANYLYNFGNGATSTVENPLYTYNLPGSFQITLVGEDSSGCQVVFSSTDIVTVDVSPIIDISFSDSNVCLNSSILVNNNSSFAQSHSWTYGSDLYSTEEPTIIASLNNSNNLVYIAGNPNGTCYDTSIYEITAHDIPDVSIIDPNTLCSNQGTTFITTANSTIYNNLLWSGNGIINSNTGLLDPSIIIDSTVIYLFHDSICVSNDSLILYVDHPDDPTILSNDSVFCENSFIPTPQVINSGGYWNGIGIDSLSGAIQNNLSLGSYIYYYVLINANNCKDSSIYQLDIIPYSDASIISPGTICSNIDTLRLNSINSGGVWSGSNINSQSGLINIDSLGFGNYDFIYSISGTCPDTDTLNLNVYEFIQAQINSSLDFCEGSDSIQLTSNSSIGFWSGLPTSDSSSGWFLTDTLQDGNYELYYSIYGNCPSSDTLIITILPNSNASIINPGIICDNRDSLILNSVDSGGIWYGPNINSQSGLIDINTLGVGNFNFVYSISGTCPDVDTLNLNIFEFVQAQIDSSLDFCEGSDSVQLTSNSNIGFWSGLPTSDSATGWFITDTLSDGIYPIYYSIYGNCPSSDTLNITFLPKPDINLTYSPTVICLGTLFEFNNLSTNIANEDYSWYINDSLYYLNFNEPYFILDTGYYEIKVIASNLLNCSTEYIFPELFPVYDTTPLPNAQVIKSSVIENQSIYTEWNSTSNYLNPLLEHQIYRSQNGDSLEYIVSVDSSVRSYIDQNVDILNNQYDYIIINKNICETSSGNSNKGNSLLLNFDRLDNFRTKLNWNLYNGWTNGTSRYELQKLNSDGIWETFINSDSTVNQIIINE